MLMFRPCLRPKLAGVLNLRGSDIPYNPVFFSWLVLPTASASKPTLFVDLDQVPQKTYDYLNQELDVLIEPYEGLIPFLQGVGNLLTEQVSTTTNPGTV